MSRLSRARTADDEIAAVLRALVVQPWLIAGRDDAMIRIARRHQNKIAGVVADLGWTLKTGDTFIRLIKAPPMRAELAPAHDPSTVVWFFLLVAAAHTLGKQATIGDLANAAMACAPDADVTVTRDRAERRAIGRAAELLEARGVLEVRDGSLSMFEIDGIEARVLLSIHHDRLLHVIGNWSDEVYVEGDPDGWIAAVSQRSRLHDRDGDRTAHRRALLGALVDSPAVLTGDLDEEGRLLLTQQVARWAGPVAITFDLVLERRADGVAFVAPEETFSSIDELGRGSFPRARTIDLVAISLCDLIDTDGGASAWGRSWRVLPASTIARCVAALSADRVPKEYGGRPDRLVAEIQRILVGCDLIRVDEYGWHLSPVFKRWEPLPNSLTLEAESATSTLPADEGLVVEMMSLDLEGFDE